MLPVLALLLPAFAPPAAAPATVDPALPRVLLIGDSISIGYTDPVRKELAGEANVYRIPGNGAATKHGLVQLDDWLGEEEWDVIHVNWGLHDLKYMDAAGKLVPVEQGTQQVPPEEYRKNLTLLFDRLEKTGAEVIWATTTPVPQGSHGRIGGDAVKYNALAAEVVKGRDVQVNDLHAVASADLAKWQKPRNVHFTDEGSEVLAKAVAQAVRTALKDAAQPAAAR
ncbi:SGNH/GDSL hydrolase family protein [Alienimonas californiensis]|uniref:GDSL-like Lipase/Acylhydrolase n=1 Tax=Alienimonas californiensis TaxID=2527989 RepID=A0A517PEZ1_9PLAN|nr:SGNH/GDSL hydrolase family protein [Alienimonas californiensis]QDT17949.1 GDSL-like Lipase/Acylhydrolase [Alienimonas californiensis]